MSDPDVIRAEIDATRARLSDNVDALAYQANPKNMARRQVDKVKDAGGDLVSKVMGKSEEVKGNVADRVEQAAGSASDSLSAAGEAIGDKAAQVGEGIRRTPQTAKARTQGMPLTAGLVAFGIGAIAGSLLPSSEREREAAAQLRVKAEPLKQEAADMARDIGESMREPAMTAAETVKEVATDAAETVKAESQQAAAEVQDTAAMTKEQVREDASAVAADLRESAKSAATASGGNTGR